MTAATLTLPPSRCASDGLTRGLIARDERAFRALYREHAQAVFRIARRFCTDDADAEEVVQETFIAVFESIGRFRGESKLSTWLYRVTVNQALKRTGMRSCSAMDQGTARYKRTRWRPFTAATTTGAEAEGVPVGSAAVGNGRVGSTST